MFNCNVKILGIILAILVSVDIILATLLFNSGVFLDIAGLITPKISATSQVPNQKVKIENIDFLEKKLQEVSFWTKDDIIFFDTNGKKYRTKVKKLEIVVSREPQNFMEFSAPDSSAKQVIYKSYGFSFDNKTSKLTIMLQLSPSFVAMLDEVELDSYYNVLLLDAIYNITHSNYLANAKKQGGRLDGIDNYITSGEDKKILRILNRK